MFWLQYQKTTKCQEDSARLALFRNQESESQTNGSYFDY